MAELMTAYCGEKNKYWLRTIYFKVAALIMSAAHLAASTEDFWGMSISFAFKGRRHPPPATQRKSIITKLQSDDQDQWKEESSQRRGHRGK